MSAIVRQGFCLAAREHIIEDSLIAAALTAQLDHAQHRPARRPRGLAALG